MADVSKIDIDGVQWNIKDEYLRNYVLPVNGSLKEYIRNQNRLDVPETIIGGTTLATAVTASYDGFLTIGGGGSVVSAQRGFRFYIKHKNVSTYQELLNIGDADTSHVHYFTMVVPIKRGDTFYTTFVTTKNRYYAQWYKWRDYS